VNLPELDAVLDRALHEPLSDPDYQKPKNALHALAGLATPARTTEKMESVLEDIGETSSSEHEPEGKKPARKPGHGRNGADAFSGADRKPVRHARHLRRRNREGLWQATDDAGNVPGRPVCACLNAGPVLSDFVHTPWVRPRRLV
jgi:hypothetical protein